MTSRREFLRAASLTALPLAAGLSLPLRAGTAQPRAAIRTILVEPEVAESRTFGVELAARGAEVHALHSGDVTRVWLDTLQPAWRRAPSPVAGLTRPTALFVVEQLAWSQGLRVVYHAEHVRLSSGRVQHLVHRDAQGLAPSPAQLALLDSLWPDRIAAFVGDLGATSRAGPCGPSCAALQPRLPEGADLLASWIIAPV